MPNIPILPIIFFIVFIKVISLLVSRVRPVPRAPDPSRRGPGTRIWWALGWLVRKVFPGKGLSAFAHVPILACVGMNGGGKSLCAAAIVQRHVQMDRRRGILSNVVFYDWNWRPGPGQTEDDRPIHPNYTPLTSFDQILEATHCVIHLDEITGVANSREAARMPVQLLNAFMQQRRADNIIIWTAPAYGRADKGLREVTQGVIDCRGFLAEPSFDPVTGRRLAWGSKRVFRWLMYDAADFDAWDAKKAEKLKPAARLWHWRKHHTTHIAYRTLDAVSTLDHIHDTGYCMTCGGTRTRPKCSCGKLHPVVASVTATAPKALPEGARAVGSASAPVVTDHDLVKSVAIEMDELDNLFGCPL